MNTLILLLCAIALIAFYYISTFNRCWNLLLRNLSAIIFGKLPVYRIFKNVYETCKKTGVQFMGFNFFNASILVITHPDLIKQVIITDFSYFTDRLFYRNDKNLLSIHLSSAKGHEWKKMREQLTPAFSPSKMKYMCSTLLEVGNQLKSVLDKSTENHEVVNLKDVCGKYMVDAIGMSIFGIECNTLQNLNVEFKNFAENTFGGSVSQNIKFMLSLMCPSVLNFFKISLITCEIQKFYLDLVKTTVEYRERNNVVRNDLMHSIIQLINNIDIERNKDFNLTKLSENEKSIRIQEITAQALLFFGGTYENSTSTISLCIYELALNEDVQNKLRNEIRCILEEHKGKVDYDVIAKMTYLEKCVLETLRKHALVGAFTRVCTKKYKLPNTDIILDVGTTLYVPIYEIHQDPEYYPSPEEFDPERFSAENREARPNYTFLSLGDGQRSCIGARLGLLLVKIFLVTFLSNYNFTINSKVKLPAPLSKSNMIVSLKNPLYLNMEKI